MTKHIKTGDYDGEERRLDMPRLDSTFKSWLPIFTPVIVIVFTFGIYAFVVKDTAILAKETVCKVEVNDLSSRERDEKLNVRATANETRIVRVEECIVGIKGQLEDIKQQNARILNKIDRITQ